MWAAKTTIDKIQAVENRVWKYLLGLGGFTSLESLRDEIRASMMTSRIMETMLSFIIDTLLGEFKKVKSYMLYNIETVKGQWMRLVNHYRSILDISWEYHSVIDL